MTDRQPERRKLHTRRKEDKNLVRALASACAFLFVVVVVLGFWLFTTVDNVDNNTNKIDSALKELRKVERGDTRGARLALYRICEREQHIKAAIHWAYQRTIEQKIRPTGNQVVDELITAQKVEAQKTLTLYQDILPILECSPNLELKAATPLNTKAQERYVREFIFKVKPSPPRDPALDRRPRR